MIARSIMALPTLFLSHGGGPGFFMKVDPSSPFADISMDSAACKALKDVGANRSAYGLPEKPEAIVIVSAHWEEDDAYHVLNRERPGIIYDYYGFPPSTYDLKYPAPGNPTLASRVVNMINSARLKRKAVLDDDRSGYDHGVFLPLLILYPEANIPIVQISLHSSLDPFDHLQLGKAIAPLRHENVLIVGSGSFTHPMGPGGTAEKTDAFVRLFNGHLTGSMPGDEREKYLMADWKDPLVRATHIPRSEHLLPLAITVGAAKGEQGRDLFKRDKDFRFMGGLFSMGCYLFRANDPGLQAHCDTGSSA